MAPRANLCGGRASRSRRRPTGSTAAAPKQGDAKGRQALPQDPGGDQQGNPKGDNRAPRQPPRLPLAGRHAVAHAKRHRFLDQPRRLLRPACSQQQSPDTFQVRPHTSPCDETKSVVSGCWYRLQQRSSPNKTNNDSQKKKKKKKKTSTDIYLSSNNEARTSPNRSVDEGSIDGGYRYAPTRASWTLNALPNWSSPCGTHRSGVNARIDSCARGESGKENRFITTNPPPWRGRENIGKIIYMSSCFSFVNPRSLAFKTRTKKAFQEEVTNPEQHHATR